MKYASIVSMSSYKILELEFNILQTCNRLFGENNNLKVFVPDYSYGHLSTNAPMLFAKSHSLTPLQVFDSLKNELEKIDFISSVEFVKGFCNIRLTHTFMAEAIKQILELKENFGSQKQVKPIKVNVEYISVNPTGPLHLGHLRGLYGDILSRALSALGYSVTREYVINNVGNQIEILGQSVYHQYCLMKGVDSAAPDEVYPGEYVKDIAKNLFNHNLQRTLLWDNSTDKQHIIDFSVDHMLGLAKEELKLLSVDFDVWRYESDVRKGGYADKAIEILESKGLVAREVMGDIKAKKGASSNSEVKVFKIDEESKALTKPDGSLTYFAGDLGYHLDKIDRGFDWIIDFFGADHDAHVNKLIQGVKAISPSVNLSVIVFQVVDFIKGNDKIKFSKRGGTIFRPSDIAKELPDIAIFRLLMASKKPDSHLTINLDHISKITVENPFYYIQYAFARSCSILEQGSEYLGSDKVQIDVAHYTSEMLELLYILTQWPIELNSISKTLNISNIVNYLENISSRFHSIWTMGHSNQNSRWIQRNDKAITKTRLELIKSFKYVMQSCMNILNIHTYSKMP